MFKEVNTIDISQQQELNFPKVSVVTITYNHEAYIKETMDGVLMQNYPGEIEFIIANDCSSDNSDQVIKEYLATKTIPQNITIKYTNHTTNKGMIPNFVWAMQQASGAYIAMCEGDDFWTNDCKIQKQVAFLEENQKFILCGHQVYLKNFKGEIEIKTEQASIAFTQAEMFDIHIPTLSTVFRNVLKDIPEKIVQSPSGDRLLWAYLGNFGDYFMMSDCMAVYRQHSGGVWSGVSEINKIKYSIISKIAALKFIKDKDNATFHNLKLCRLGIYKSIQQFDLVNLISFIFLFIISLFHRILFIFRFNK